MGAFQLQKEACVNAEQLRCYEQRCILADGPVRKFSAADFEIDKPYFTGQVECFMYDKSVYDLVLGNIKGVRPANNPDEKWRPPVSNDFI